MINRPRVSLSEALESATETHALELGRNVLGRVVELFRRSFPNRAALVVADPNTFAAAGRNVWEHLQAAGLTTGEPFLFNDPALYAEHQFVAQLEQALVAHPQAVPVAIGSGTINDLSKLAAHRTGRRYLVVATAASMDGYTAFGASITFNGSKQTFACPAPVAVLADLDIIAAAPAQLNAAGYADLLAKTCGGADWLLADALGVEPLHPRAWEIVQGSLHEALADPEGVRRGDLEALQRLTEGLLLSGFGMQAAGSSRPASGAEHQFSHLWDMEHHLFQGKTPLHGFKVAIGTLASTALYEHLLAQPLESLDIDRCCVRWAQQTQRFCDLRRSLMLPELVAVAEKESRAKDVDALALRSQLEILRRVWPKLQPRLREQILPLSDVRARLRKAGAPFQPQQIGISRDRLRHSFWPSWSIRRRFTVLDLAARLGLLDPALDCIYGKT